MLITVGKIIFRSIHCVNHVIILWHLKFVDISMHDVTIPFMGACTSWILMNHCVRSVRIVWAWRLSFWIDSDITTQWNGFVVHNYDEMSWFILLFKIYEATNIKFNSRPWENLDYMLIPVSKIIFRSIHSVKHVIILWHLKFVDISMNDVTIPFMGACTSWILMNLCVRSVRIVWAWRLSFWIDSDITSQLNGFLVHNNDEISWFVLLFKIHEARNIKFNSRP